MNKKRLIILLSILFIIIYIGVIFINKTTYSYQSLYEALPENSIIIGDEVYTNYVNPNNIANKSIEVYKKTNEKNVKIYKYNGLDIEGNPIWGTYSDEHNGYIEISNEEITKIEDVLKEKYAIN